MKIHEIFQAFEAGKSPGELYAALEAIPLNDSETLDALFKGFECSEWRGVLAVTRALKKWKPASPVAVTRLIAALDHEETLVRTGAAETLAAYGAETAISPILKLLRGEPDSFTRAHYVKALGEIAKRADVVLPVLVKIVDRNDSDFLVETSLKAIGAFGAEAKSTLPFLIGALSSEHHGVRYAAVSAIAKTGAAGFLPKLLDYLKTADDGEASFAMSKFSGDPDVAVPFVDAMCGRNVDLDAFATHLDDAALDRLAEKLKTDARSHAAHLIGLSGANRLGPKLVQVLDSQDLEVIEALGALGEGLDALAALEAKATGDVKDVARRELRRHRRKVAIPADGLDLSKAAVHRLDVTVARGSSMQIGAALWVPVLKIRTAAPKESWSDDEDEIGLLRIETSGATYIKLPVAFPLKPNGANGAKREVAIAGMYGPGILLQVKSPFSDARGWGADNFLYIYRPETGWSQHGAPQMPSPEDPKTSACFGELNVRFEKDHVALVADSTPYHLDDWEHSETVFGSLGPLPGAPPTKQIDVEVATDLRWKVGPFVLYDIAEFVQSKLDVRGQVSPMAAMVQGNQLAMVIRVHKEWRDPNAVDALFVWG